MATCINKQGSVAEGSLLDHTSSARRRICRTLGPLSVFLHFCNLSDLVKSSDSSADLALYIALCIPLDFSTDFHDTEYEHDTNGGHPNLNNDMADAPISELGSSDTSAT
jgi:hypothetical protein